MCVWPALAAQRRLWVCRACGHGPAGCRLRSAGMHRGHQLRRTACIPLHWRSLHHWLLLASPCTASDQRCGVPRRAEKATQSAAEAAATDEPERESERQEQPPLARPQRARQEDRGSGSGAGALSDGEAGPGSGGSGEAGQAQQQQQKPLYIVDQYISMLFRALASVVSAAWHSSKGRAA